MAHFSNPPEVLPSHVLQYKKTYKPGHPKPTSMTQQHCNFNTNCHRVSAKEIVKKIKEPTTMTNHDPRINRISSNSLIELTPNIARLLGSLILVVPCVFLMLIVGACVFLECVLLLCACACFGLSALKTLWCIKPGIGSLSKMCFPSHPLMSSQVAYLK
jgi:hypothetical protein